MQCLDIGCGNAKTPGCVGIDRVALPGVDIVHNLDQFPWPFLDSSYSMIYANHYLEHAADIVKTLREIHRIAEPGAQLFFRVPHYASDNFNSDLTHRNGFGYRSFDHFSVNGSVKYTFYETFKFEIVRRRIKFMSPLSTFDPFKYIGFESLVNLIPRLYERFFVYWIPPAEVQFELRVIK